jgi:RimJ/RimL family protein N-acetyltransferase
MSIPTLETERLILRGFVPQDLDRLATILANPNVMRYMPGNEPLTRERSEKTLNFVRNHWEQHGFGWWAVICKEDELLAGWCGLTLLDETSEVEVAYLLAQEHWGRGYATEAARASVRYGFEQLGLDTIIALAFAENVPSRRVMEKLCMQFTGEAHYFGLDLMRYVLTKEGFLSWRDEQRGPAKGTPGSDV